MTSMPDPSPESEVLPRVPATPTAPLPDEGQGRSECEICSYADEHGAWPPAHRGTHCRKCHRSWTGLREAHCTVCHAHFSTDNHAQSHRGRNGACIPPGDVLRTDLTPRMRLVDRGSGPLWTGSEQWDGLAP